MTEQTISEPLAPGPRSPGSMSTAWLVVALLVPVALLNYMDRQMLASMKTSVMSDIEALGPDTPRGVVLTMLEWTMGDLENLGADALWGVVLALFKWTYAFLSPLGGYVADRFGRKRVIVSSLFIWSMVTWGTGHVTTYEQLLSTRALMGVSEAFYIPAALALISDYHLGPTRSRAVGYHQMGIYLGVILGGFSGYIADEPSLGWRWAFSSAGLIGMLYALPLILLLKDPPRPASDSAEQRMSPVRSLVALLSNLSFILLVLYFTLPALAGWVVRDWMPSILKEEFGIGQGKAGVSATLYWQVAAIFGAILGGALADRWMRHTERGRIYVSALGMAMIVPAMFGVGFAPQTGMLWVAILFLALFGLGWGFFDCNNMPILCQIVRPHLRASGYGMMNLVSISCGGLADVGFGVLKNQGVPLFGIFSLFASLAIVSIVLVLLIRPRYTD